MSTNKNRRPININEVLKLTQQDINNLDSAATTKLQDMIYNLKTVIRGDLNPIFSVDSAALLPNITDNISEPDTIVYVKSEKNIFFNTTNNLGDPVWKPIKIQLPFQGRHYGFVSGGSYSNNVDRFSFASGTEDATSVGTLDTAKRYAAGQSSDVNGYSSGGQTPPATSITGVNKFPLVNSFSNIASTSNLSQARHGSAGLSTIPNSTGYTAGGNNGSNVNTIDKFKFSNDNTSVATNSLTIVDGFVSGNSGEDAGYVSGAVGLHKISYANDAVSLVGGLSSELGASGQTSATSGYSSGGVTLPNTYSNAVVRFPFANDTNVVSVGVLTNSSSAYAAGASSKTHGYRAGGTAPDVNTIDRIDFASDVDATAVGSLSTTSFGYAGHQY